MRAWMRRGRRHPPSTSAAVVERGDEPHKSSPAHPDAAVAGPDDPDRGTSPVEWLLMNRRMPNGTSGGVASRAGQPARLPDRLGQCIRIEKLHSTTWR